MAYISFPVYCLVAKGTLAIMDGWLSLVNNLGVNVEGAMLRHCLINDTFQIWNLWQSWRHFPTPSYFLFGPDHSTVTVLHALPVHGPYFQSRSNCFSSCSSNSCSVMVSVSEWTKNYIKDTDKRYIHLFMNVSKDVSIYNSKWNKSVMRERRHFTMWLYCPGLTWFDRSTAWLLVFVIVVLSVL